MDNHNSKPFFRVNIFLTILGALILLCGGVGLSKIDAFQSITSNDVIFPLIAYVIGGLLIFGAAVLEILGQKLDFYEMPFTFCNKWKLNRLHIYFVLLIISLILMVLAAVYSFVLGDTFDKANSFGLITKRFIRYYQDEEDQKFIDFVQKSTGCCGITSPEDFTCYTKSEALGTWGVLPWSCCDNEFPDPCLDRSKVHKIGCKDILIEGSVHVLIVFAALAVLTSLFMLGILMYLLGVMEPPTTIVLVTRPRCYYVEPGEATSQYTADAASFAGSTKTGVSVKSSKSTNRFGKFF